MFPQIQVVKWLNTILSNDNHFLFNLICIFFHGPYIAFIYLNVTIYNHMLAHNHLPSDPIYFKMYSM